MQRASKPRAVASSRRFGRIACVAVALPIAAGIVMAWRLAGDFAALVGTGYGLALLAKVSGLAILFVTAGLTTLAAPPDWAPLNPP